MGLDASHNCWHGAYSAFSRWRDHLAQTAGYTFSVKEGDYAFPSADIDWGSYPLERYAGEWGDAREDDALLYLMVHSDCDGVIHPEQAAPLADRLEELLPQLDESKSGGHITSMRGDTQQFIDGLRAAAGAGEDVEFY